MKSVVESGTEPEGRNMQVPGNAQLHLAFGHTEQSLEQLLAEQTGKRVKLVITDNGSSMLFRRTDSSGIDVRVHRIFLHAGNGVIEEIVSFVRGKREKMPRFRAFIRENRQHLHARPPRRISVRTKGKIFDLRDLFDEINKEYFSNAVTSPITWGARCPRTAVRKRTLGSFSERLNLIRINPLLDRKAVPRYYIAFVVYHEMLHAALGINRTGGRASIHSREFRRREKFYRDYERAIAWEKGNV